MNENRASRLERWVVSVISIVFAITLWMFISYTTNPDMQKTFGGVDISYDFGNSALGGSSTDQKTLVGDYPLKTDVTVKGKRNDIIGLKAEDIKVNVDLSGASLGSRDYKPLVSFPSLGFTLVNLEQDEIKLTIDRLVTKEFEIKVEEIGSLEGGKRLDYDLAQNTVKLSGAASEVDKVKMVAAVVNVTDIEDGSVKKIGLEFIPKEGEGLKPLVSASISEVSLVARVMLQKTVDLVYTISKETEGDFSIIEKKLKYEKVTIDGPAKIIEETKNIACKPVDASAIKTVGVHELELSPLLPSGVVLKSKNKLTLSLVVDEFIRKRLMASEFNLVLKNAPEKFVIDLARPYQEVVEVSGFSELIKKMDLKNMSIEVQASAVESGTYSAAFDIVGSADGISFKKLSDKIDLIVYGDTD